ncbi:outer membrane beta-barrel family protein [Mangrovivirga sp. M17]|uniref:Outer membrane beta-barrel family protein n=1 Tax=Mangrovivirga halotolerans TaxID=2993936 RepID=A0ABT3RPF4_9BACT|nr:outer membrane beta-barrel family protein [Mangrovivirga halotolerans]MCX2743050.1 outer membrane beta-barrel family protein [Mangrovivirga halotolerans]
MRYFTIIFTLLLISTSHFLFSQNSVIKGIVIDESSGEVLPYAQVAIYEDINQSPFTGATTNDDGRFNIPVKSGKYDVLISFVGYDDKILKDLEVSSDGLDLGKIAIVQTAKEMDAVVVEGSKINQPIKSTIEGLEVRPDQTLTNLGGSLLDVLRNTPSVRVSSDGSVSLRGSSNTNILLDGRNSAMTSDLEQIPASAIKSIEIVTNPNAKYDAAAAGGVINIKLKQGEDLGTTGKIEGTIGTRMRTNTNINISHKTNKYSIYGGYSYRSWPRVGSSWTERITYSDNRYLYQDNTDERKDREHTFNIGGDYIFSSKHKLSYEGAFNKEFEDDYERRRTRLEDLDDGTLINAYTRDNNETEDNFSMDNAIIYEYLFEDSTKSFRALASSSFRDQLEEQDIDVYNGTTDPEVEPNAFERSINDEFRRTSVIQADYQQSLFNGKLEAGYKSTFRSFDNDYKYEIYDNAEQEWINQVDITNRFLYEDQIHAGYFIYSNNIKKIDYSFGVRGEGTIVDTKLFTTGETNGQRYFNLFPSARLAYNLTNKSTFKVTYSRRIDRPGGWRLNPFPDVSDSLNVRVGNPNLQPEYINSFELGYMFDNGKINITANGFYRNVDGQVDWIVEVVDGISYRGPRNLVSSQTYGFEIINTTNVLEWWSLNMSYSLFQTEVDGTNIDEGFTNSGLAWYAKFTSDFKLPLDINIQLTGNYESPEIEAQGRDLARYYIDATVQRGFGDFNVSLTMRDVFNTRRFAGENIGSDFEQRFERKRETQIFLLTVGYNFDL